MIHAEDAADRYQGPVLILHGDEDDTVPLADSAAYAQRYARCDLQVLSGESHHFDRKPEQMRTILREWMKKQRTVC